MKNTIGIDVWKDTLVVHRLSEKPTSRFQTTRLALPHFLRWLRKTGAPRVVFEPTGPYHRRLAKTLAASAIAMIKVNPRQSRRFAEAIGQFAKTDRGDAAMLTRMGATLDLEARAPKSELLHDLSELLVTRQGLIRDRTAQKNRLDTAVLAQIKR